ncbi:MAG: sulfocyanin-like copper-binding protein [Acidimicrobiales bacterium]
MATSISPPSTGPSPRKPWLRRRLVVAVVGVTVVAAAGLGISLAVGTDGFSPTPGAVTSYSYFQSVMGRYRIGSMMGSSNYGWIMGRSGYGWMMGSASAPGWMTGGSLPSFMMGTNSDPGKVMGALFANAPGPRVSPAEAASLGTQALSGATVDRTSNRVTFTSRSVRLVVLASPSMPAENFHIAGMVNPTVVVPVGAHVRIELVNADSDMAHGFVIAADGPASSWMPMMAAAPAFPGAALWFLGEATSAGMHEGILAFTATTPGTYQYLCPVPGHAQEGMVGSFDISRTA